MPGAVPRSVGPFLGRTYETLVTAVVELEPESEERELAVLDGGSRVGFGVGVYDSRMYLR